MGVDGGFVSQILRKQVVAVGMGYYQVFYIGKVYSVLYKMHIRIGREIYQKFAVNNGLRAGTYISAAFFGRFFAGFAVTEEGRPPLCRRRTEIL